MKTELAACCICGTTNPFADLVPAMWAPGWVECREEYDCVRRKQMNMGPLQESVVR